MKLLVIGKCPPLQGGVSARTFNFARNMVDAGHEVIFISNSLATPPTYQCAFDNEDEEYLRNALGSAKHISLSSSRKMNHIPFSESFETRLYSVGMEHAASVDLIVGWYFQPYGLVAAMLASRFKKKCVILHAGSDLGRLSLSSEFSNAYKDIFSGATILTTRDETESRLKDMFGDNDSISIERIRRGSIQPNYYRSRSKPIKLSELKALALSHIPSWRLKPEFETYALSLLEKDINPNATTIGAYGKVGTTKGHYELISALQRLAEKGAEFNFLMCAGGNPRIIHDILSAIRDSPSLSARTLLFPFISPWKVPRFIKSCDAIAFLERDFDITFHGPQVPREVLWSGRALLLSREIYDKQAFKDLLIDKQNFIDCGDPRDISSLMDNIQYAIEDRNRLREIGARGNSMIVGVEQSAPCIDPVARTINEVFSAHNTI